MTPTCLELGQALYQHAIRTLVPVSSPRAVEMTKLLENIHRAVNIGQVNEMKIVADKMGINIHEVIRAAATKPFGFTPYAPGCLILATDYDRLDYDTLRLEGALIVDTRGRLPEVKHAVSA